MNYIDPTGHFTMRPFRLLDGGGGGGLAPLIAMSANWLALNGQDAVETAIDVKDVVDNGISGPGLAAVGADVLAMASPAPARIDGPTSAALPRADFYVRPNGEVIPAIGYRYVSKEAQYLSQMQQSMTIPANPNGTYFSFDRYDTPPSAAIQVPHDASVRVSFDTLQLDDLRIPKENWGAGPDLEPITRSYPQFGPGGATQAITNRAIIIRGIKRLAE